MQNMWQLNAEEINRPGNFSTHARRNLDLLFKVLSYSNDANSLLFLAQHLKNKPDAARQYLRDNERQAMFKKVYIPRCGEDTTPYCRNRCRPVECM